jgi:formylglycine-generating enzyme required for sulfatase activity
MRRLALVLALAGCFDFDGLSKEFGSAIDAGDDGGGNPDGAPACVTTTGQVQIPAGMFRMGCVTGDTNCNSDENPGHMVFVSAFTIDRVEVTQREYNMCVAASMCAVPSCGLWDPLQYPNIPVECITWASAKNFCTFAGGRLPTEAEWEMAARGPNGASSEFPWGNAPPDCTWVNYAACPQTQGIWTPTSCMNASPFGVLDMSGNVNEWVADWYSATYYGTSPTMNPQGPGTGTMRVVRGGSLNSIVSEIRSSARGQYDPVMDNIDLGFRCVNRTR